MAHTIVHFEVPADDVGRAQKFYGDLFGWTFQDVGNDYHLIQTGGEPAGGMMKRMAPQQPILNYIGVENIDDFQSKAEGLGAKVLMPKTAVPSMGWFTQLQDPEGNLFALWQEDGNAA